MFTNLLREKNPELIDYALFLHKKGILQPDTYVLDGDRILENYHLIVQKAQSFNIESLVMTKQFGRHPLLIQELNNLGAEYVVVDFREAETIINLKGKLAHVGHLVQIPLSMIPQILSARPKLVTVYSLDQAYFINKEAKEKNFVQDILLRIIQKPYNGQESQQFTKDSLLEMVLFLQQYSHIRLVGLTSFPCFIFNQEINQVKATDNAYALIEMFDFLNQEGHSLFVKNMPSHNNYHTIPLIAELGGTQIEPGHSLTGTCPYHHAYPYANEEKIALAYLSEISHCSGGVSYCYGGGYYRRSQWSYAYVAQENNLIQTTVLPLSCEAIDYTIGLQGVYPIGAGVISSFRTQIFVTRSRVALIKGLSTNNPQLAGVSDSQGVLIK